MGPSCHNLTCCIRQPTTACPYSCQKSAARDKGMTVYAQVAAAERVSAQAVLVFNSIPDGEPSGGLMEMGGDGGAELPSIPAVLVSQARILCLRHPFLMRACDLRLRHKRAARASTSMFCQCPCWRACVAG